MTAAARPEPASAAANTAGACGAQFSTAGTATFPGERHNRLTRRIGGNRASCAVGRSILVIIWHLLNDPSARFADLGPGWHDRKTSRDRTIRTHLRQLQALGVHVQITKATA